MGEHKSLREQLNDINEKIIASLDKEDTEAQAAMANRINTDGWTPELPRDTGYRTAGEHLPTISRRLVTRGPQCRRRGRSGIQ